MLLAAHVWLITFMLALDFGTDDHYHYESMHQFFSAAAIIISKAPAWIGFGLAFLAWTEIKVKSTCWVSMVRCELF
jgi:hypothetical protein